MSEYTSPFVDGLMRLVVSEEYQALKTMYDEEEKLVLQEIHNAQDDRALRIAQGKYRELKKIVGLPDAIINRHLAEKREQ